jgi:recombination protein RecT
MSEQNKSVQKQENAPAKITNPSEAIAAAKQRFLSVMPQETFVKEANFALQIIQNNPKGWQNVDLVSIRSAVENIAFTGLTLNPAMKLAYLIPRKGKAVLDPSYMGLTKILTDSGSVKKLSAVVVYDDEKFEYNASTRMVVVHEQRYAETEKEHMARKVVGAYSCATLADGSLDYEYMPAWELEKIKSKSDGANSQYSPWQENNWADEMRKKTVIKRHYKYLPKSEQISNAIDLDNQQFIVEKPSISALFEGAQEVKEENVVEDVQDLNQSQDGKE